MDASRPSPQETAARLRAAGERLGDSWTARPELARRVLHDLLPEDEEGVDALAVALESGIVDRLSSTSDTAPLAARLSAERGLPSDLADWSLQVWRDGLPGAQAPGSSARAAAPADRADTAQAALRRGRTAVGDSLLADPVVARRVLADLLPSDPAAVSVLVAAVRDGVPRRLLSDLPHLPEDLVLGRLAESLTEQESIATDRARWAVSVWAVSLGLIERVPPALSTTPPERRPEGEKTVVRAATGGDATTLHPDDRESTQMRPATGAASGGAAGTGAAGAARTGAVSTGPTAPLEGAAAAGSLTRRRALLVVVAAVAVLAAVGTGVWFAMRPAAAKTHVTAQRTSAAATRPPAPSASPTPSASATSTGPVDPLVAGHRGGDERYAPETAEALLDAASRPDFAAETDMRWTSDGVPVLAHDDTVQSPMVCTGGTAHPIVAKTTYATLERECRTEASASPQGGRYPIPRMTDVAQRLAGTKSGQWLLEIKTTLTAKQEDVLFETLQHDGIVDRTVITSFYPTELAKARTEAASRHISIRLMLFVQDERTSPSIAAHDGLWGVAVATKALTKNYVGALHTAGVTALEWTPNTPAEWEQAAADGVDLVVTDKPIAWQQWNAAR